MFFIPKHGIIDGGIIDFQDKLSLETSQFIEKVENKEIERLGVISMPFLRDLIQRYSSYYSRQGAPDFDTEEVLKYFLI